MEKTENMVTVHAEEVSPEEITKVRSAIYNLVDDHLITKGGPLVETIRYILDTLEAGKGVTIFTRLPPEDLPPEDYVLAHG